MNLDGAKNVLSGVTEGNAISLPKNLNVRAGTWCFTSGIIACGALLDEFGVAFEGFTVVFL
jgi:hypothetical protein